MRIINIIDNASPINYGIWHAAVVNASLLKAKGISTEIWYNQPKDFLPIKDVTIVYFESSSIKTLINLMKERDLNSAKDIIVTHGCWRFPTRWGAYLKKQGFLWIYVPHGMLEDWPLQQKRIKKLLYFYFVEKRLPKIADIIRAVSLPERSNLEIKFKHRRVEFIPNAVSVQDPGFKTNSGIRQYLFLSRLHPKKNVLSLANAWLRSSLNNNQNYLLLIVGPDQGDLPLLESCIEKSRNMKYLGSVFGDKKDELFKSSAFYVLPSFSEGLPSSLLEAMAFSLVPIITDGCNLPEVFTADLGVKITTETISILEALEETSNWSESEITAKAIQCRQFIVENYSISTITDKQMSLFSSLKMFPTEPLSQA